MTYYYANQVELDAQMAVSLRESMALAVAGSDAALRQRLSGLKHSL